MKCVLITAALLAVWAAPITGAKPRYRQPRHHQTNGTPLTHDDLQYLLQSSLRDYSDRVNNYPLYLASLFPEHVAVPSVDTQQTGRTRRSVLNLELTRRLAEVLSPIWMRQQNHPEKQVRGDLMKESAMARLLSAVGEAGKGM